MTKGMFASNMGQSSMSSCQPHTHTLQGEGPRREDQFGDVSYLGQQSQ